MPSAQTDLRPRLWVPGVAWVSEEREVLVGAHVGFNGHGEAFAQTRCAHVGSLRDWRHRVWLLERAALDDAVIDEHAIVVAERLLDAQVQPHARRWFEQQPLVCVSGSKVQRLVDAGLRVYTVEHGVDGDDFFAVCAEGGKRAPWELRGSLDALLPREKREGARSEKREVRTLVDRLLAGVSRGVLREASVLNALAARTLIEPGYGYHGARDGVAAPLERIERDVRALDALFEQIDERAESSIDDAREVARAISRAADDVEDVRLPIYDRARREDVAEMSLMVADDDGPSWTVGGERQTELTLARSPRWIVSRVKTWTPTLPASLQAELSSGERRAAPSPWVAVALVVLLAAIIALGLGVGR
jgi:hypothetical protein